MDYDAVAIVNKYGERLCPGNDIKKILRALQKLNGVDMTVAILHKTGIGKSVNKLKKISGVGDYAKQIVAKWKSLLVPSNEPSVDAQYETKSASDEDEYDPAGNWEMNRQNNVEVGEEYDPTQNWKMQKEKSKKKKNHHSKVSSNCYDDGATNKSTTSEDSSSYLNKSRKKASKKPAVRAYDEPCSDDEYPSSRESNLSNASPQSETLCLENEYLSPDSSTYVPFQSDTVCSEDECHSPDRTSYTPSVQSTTVYTTSYDGTSRDCISTNLKPGKSKHFNMNDSAHGRPEHFNSKKTYKSSSKVTTKVSPKTAKIKEEKKVLPTASADKRMEGTSSKRKHKLENAERSVPPAKIRKMKHDNDPSTAKINNKEKVKPSKHVKVMNSSKSDTKDKQKNGEIKRTKRDAASTKKATKKAEDMSFEQFMMMDTTKVAKKKKIMKNATSSSTLKPASKAVPAAKPKVELHLPQIQQTYRPLPNTLTHGGSLPSKPSKMTDAMAAELHTQRSSNKMVVYSGQKKSTLTEVLSLYDQCMAVLKNNIDRLDVIGVPYDIIKPVLERCTVEQLYRLEDANNYLLDDSDELWQKHALIDFKSHRPDEMESWREMYLRLHDEREQKLARLTHSIQAKVNKARPLEKRTKLAYVGIGEAKAPRNVLRAQLKYGTAGKKPIPYQKTSSSRQGSSSESIRQQAIDVRMAVPVGSITAATVDNAHPSRPLKKQPPRVAPMMAKALKSFKHRYKR